MIRCDGNNDDHDDDICEYYVVFIGFFFFKQKPTPAPPMVSPDYMVVSSPSSKTTRQTLSYFFLPNFQKNIPKKKKREKPINTIEHFYSRSSCIFLFCYYHTSIGMAAIHAQLLIFFLHGGSLTCRLGFYRRYPHHPHSLPLIFTNNMIYNDDQRQGTRSWRWRWYLTLTWFAFFISISFLFVFLIQVVLFYV